LNSLKCFVRFAGESGADSEICIDLERGDYIIGCLVGFAKSQNDLSVCEMYAGNDCVEILIQNEEQCNQLKKQENIDDCLQNFPHWGSSSWNI